MEKITRFPQKVSHSPSWGWRVRIGYRRAALFFESHPILQAVSLGLFMLGASYALLFALLAVL